MTELYTNIDFVKQLYSDNDRIYRRGSFLKKHSNRKYSIRDVIIMLLGTPTNKNFLDFGAGNGSFLEKMATLFPQNKYFALDISQNKSIETVKNISYKVYDGQHYPMYVKKFDCILLMNVLYHIKYKQKLFLWLDKQLAKGGMIFITTKSIKNFPLIRSICDGFLNKKVPAPEQNFCVENMKRIILNTFLPEKYEIQFFTLKTQIITNNFSDVLDYIFSCIPYQGLRPFQESIKKTLEKEELLIDEYTEGLVVLKKKGA